MSDNDPKDNHKADETHPAETDEEPPETLVLHSQPSKRSLSSRRKRRGRRVISNSTGTDSPAAVARYDGNQLRSTFYGPTETNKRDVRVNIAVMDRKQMIAAGQGSAAPDPPLPDPQPPPPIPEEPSPPPPSIPEELSPPPPPIPAEPSPPTSPLPSELHWHQPVVRAPSPETSILKKPAWKRGRKSIGNEPLLRHQTHSGSNLEATMYQPVDTNKRAIKVQFTVLKRKPSPIPPVRIAPPPPLPPPPSLLVPELPTRTPSVQFMQYIDTLSGLSDADIAHGEDPATGIPDGTVDAVELLKKFGIPNQTKNLDTLLDKDTVHYDFGGLMRQYYSYVLRSYALINMQERYRGASNYTNCFTTVDLSQIGTRDEEMDKQTRAKMRKLNEKREHLRKVAVDEDHFNYLKTLADNQATLLPLTIVHSMNEQLVPVLEDIFKFYGKNLGTEHDSTKEAGFYYMRIRKRCDMYNNICGGSTLDEDLSQF